MHSEPILYFELYAEMVELALHLVKRSHAVSGSSNFDQHDLAYIAEHLLGLPRSF